jgi:hypothetical protein
MGKCMAFYATDLRTFVGKKNLPRLFIAKICRSHENTIKGHVSQLCVAQYTKGSNYVCTYIQFYCSKFQASLIRRANACSCFILVRNYHRTDTWHYEYTRVSIKDSVFLFVGTQNIFYYIDSASFNVCIYGLAFVTNMSFLL